MQEGSLFSTPSPAFIVYRFFDDGHFDQCGGDTSIVVTVLICISLIISVEKAMAPHSSTLAWRVPWMEEPGGPQSMGSLGVRHD